MGYQEYLAAKSEFQSESKASSRVACVASAIERKEQRTLNSLFRCKGKKTQTFFLALQLL
jgi:hypothetical protein